MRSNIPTNNKPCKYNLRNNYQNDLLWCDEK